MPMVEPRICELETPYGRHARVDLAAAAGGHLAALPRSFRVLLENALWALVETDDPDAAQAAAALCARARQLGVDAELAFRPDRILMHDTTATPALVDIAAMRDAIAEAGGDPAGLEPALPVDVVIDHSLSVDAYGSKDAWAFNRRREYERNAERYRFLKWAGETLPSVRVFPPGTGILHTVNLEYLARLATTRPIHRGPPHLGLTVRAETMIGTDSHTPMINGLGVLGWGVGGLEAETAMFGLPVSIRLPRCVGVRLTGALRAGVTATDLALAVTEILRGVGVAGAFVEFFGTGVGSLSVGQRAAVANMAPEYGATTGYFPVDAASIRYLRETGRDDRHCALAEAHARAQGLWHDPAETPLYDAIVDLDLDTLDTRLAGPRRPQDLMRPRDLPGWLAERAAQTPTPAGTDVPDGAVALAAITSCTNTSDARMLAAAGLLARKARGLGLAPPAWVKTSFAPGSAAMVHALERAGLMDDLAALGFATVGIGCTTCIGNSGPLAPAMHQALGSGATAPVAVITGNRNFPGRIHPEIADAFLASPPLTVAFALAGHAGLDITSDPIGAARDGTPVRLAELWPTEAEIDAAVAAMVRPGNVDAAYAGVDRDAEWQALEAPRGLRFPWDESSVQLRRPPFVRMHARDGDDGTLLAHPLLHLGDDVTTDHISPAGAVPAGSPAGALLEGAGVRPENRGVYAAYRGNWQVMLRGLFTNRHLVNRLAPELPPGRCVFAPTGENGPVFEIAARYRDAGLPVVLLAGERYGTGSSRDWAAKGAHLVGIRAVLAKSFERIHRSNLVGMGILPLALAAESGEPVLAPGDRIEIPWMLATLQPHAAVTLHLRRADGQSEPLKATALIDTAQELEIFRAGGVLSFLIERQLRRPSRQTHKAASVS